MIYVDFEKAFDSIEIDAILRSLKNQGIELPYIHLLKNIYTNCTSTVALYRNKTQFEIRKGVRQGDTISPKLFTSCLEEIFHGINWSGKGINIDGEHLHHLKFADDIVLISTNTKEAEIMLNDLHSESRKYGLKINRTKTKLMINDNISATPVKHEDSEIEFTTEYIYLGQKISLQEPNQASDIKRRAQLGWVAFGKLHTIMRSNLPMSMKKKVFNQCVVPTMTYACETCATTKRMDNKLRVTQRAMERLMAGVTKKDRIRNTELRRKTKVEDIILRIKKSKWRWAGHTARQNDNRWTKRLLDWTPRIGRKNKGRPRVQWEDDIRKFWAKEPRSIWRRESNNRTKWRAHAEAFALQWADSG